MNNGVQTSGIRAGEPDGQSTDILIVDDNQYLAKGLAFLFRDAGFQPAVFHQGLAALEFAKDQQLKAAVIDIHLPDINGLILSQRLRETMGPDKPIIVLSGDGSMEVLNSLSHVGATYFFCKPVNGTTLIERVRELLI